MIVAYKEQETIYRTNPVASVIVCAYNHLNDLTIPCIESIRSNTFYPYELILIDDGSTDGSIRYFQTISRKAIRVSRRSGVAKARNAGMEAAAGDPLVFLDNDMLPPPEWLTILVEEVHKAGVGIVSGIPSNEIDRLNGKLSPDGLLEYPHVGGGCTAITRRCFDAVGYFDESLINNGEDTDFCYRARERGFRIANTPRLIVQHKGGGTRRDLDKREMARSARRFVQKHGARNPNLPTPPLYPFG
ncbi:hypothetical protein LCGC14_0990240 [marine sediment metagenome]|uniref:Glycosyltransferase 2-like domain-containing protein n=1 Tax=marine sediment metagenome TaxID=412755 RepID=A0A0F9NSQ2_9ZZZZ